MADLRQKSLLEQLEKKRKLASIAVATADPDVRKALRALGEPITLFGESVPDRRDRLKLLTLAAREADPDGASPAATPAEDERPAEEEFYHEGSSELLAARRDIARYTLRRAKYKLAHLKAQSKIPLSEQVASRNNIKETLKGIELNGSQFSDRPVSAVRFSPDGAHLAVSDWGGNVKLLDVPGLNTTVSFSNSHKDHVRGLAWMPGATTSLSPSVVNLVSGGSEGDLQLWPLPSPGATDIAPLATIHAHPPEASDENIPGEIRKLAIHPSGKYIATASSHKTWALFAADATPTADPLMEGYGHSESITSIAFDPTGTRCITGAADGLGFVWDVRAVRDIARLPLQSRGVTDLKWWRGRDGAASFADAAATSTGPTAPPTFMGGADADGDTEMAQQAPPRAGSFVLSGGFDRRVALTSTGDWAPVRSLAGHAGHVLSVDATAEDARWIASGGFDRTVKIWGRPNEKGV